MSSPYTAARLHVMHTRLVNHQEYERLMKMSDPEIINFLESTTYKEDVDAYGTQDLSDLEIVDRILNRNHNRMIQKIVRIAGDGFTEIAERAQINNDLWNLTVSAEAIAGKKDPKSALELYAKSGRIPLERMCTDTLTALGNAVAKEFPQLKDAPEEFTKFLRIIRSSRPKITDPALIDEQNILSIIRAKRQGIRDVEIDGGGTMSIALLRKASRADDLAGALALLRTTRYKDALVDDPISLQNRLHRLTIAMVRKRTRHDPLSPALLEHYLAAKEIEQENLRLLIKGKRLNVSEDFIREHLVL